jgi:hypothetical protein
LSDFKLPYALVGIRREAPKDHVYSSKSERATRSMNSLAPVHFAEAQIEGAWPIGSAHHRPVHSADRRCYGLEFQTACARFLTAPKPWTCGMAQSVGCVKTDKSEG